MRNSLASSNVDRLRNAYAQFSETRGRDYSGFIALMADDFQYISPIGGPPRPEYFRPHSGRETMIEYFESLTRDWKMVEYDAVEFVAEGDTVVMRGHCEFIHRRTGKTCMSMDFHCWSFQNGKASAVHHLFDTAAMIEATRQD